MADEKPIERAADQAFIVCWCNELFVAKIDAACRGATRSQFCRDALREKLERMGFVIAYHEAAAPPRTGKGGRHKKQIYPQATESAMPVGMLNDAASSKKITEVAAQVVAKWREDAGIAPAEPRREAGEPIATSRRPAKDIRGESGRAPSPPVRGPGKKPGK